MENKRNKTETKDKELEAVVGGAGSVDDIKRIANDIKTKIDYFSTFACMTDSEGSQLRSYGNTISEKAVSKPSEAKAACNSVLDLINGTNFGSFMYAYYAGEIRILINQLLTLL